MSGWVPAASAQRRAVDTNELLPKIASQLNIGKVTFQDGAGSTGAATSSDHVTFPKIHQPSSHEVLSASHRKKKETKSFVEKIRSQQNLVAPEVGAGEKSPKTKQVKASSGMPWTKQGTESLDQLERMTQAARSIETPTKERFQGMWCAYPEWYRNLVENSIQIRAAALLPWSRVREVQEEFSSELRHMYDGWDQVVRKGKMQVPRRYCISEDFLAAGSDHERRASFNAAKEYLENNLFITHTFSRQLLDLWTSKYSQLSFFRKLDDAMFPTDLELFEQLQQAQCQYAKEFLLQKWVSDSRKVFEAVPEHEWAAVEDLDKFIASVRCLMGVQLIELLSQYANSVLELFTGFSPGKSKEKEPLFILNLGVDEKARVSYSPNPEDAVMQVHGLLELVMEAICSIPVIPSDLCSVPNYNSLMIVLPSHAELVVAECGEQLVTICEAPLIEPNGILQQYEKFEYVLSQPYFKFPPDWTQGDKWLKLADAWKREWKQSLQLERQIEKLSMAEEEQSMFLVVTSGPDDQGLVREVLSSKARSLGKFLLNTIENHLFTQGAALFEEYDKIFQLCNGRPTLPKELLLQIEGLKGMDKQLKVLRAQTLNVKELYEMLSEFNHAIDDGHASQLYRLFFMSATASDTLRETNEYLKSTKWIVEEELRKLRNELQGALFDLTKSKLKTIEEFKIRHRSDDYLQQIQDVLDELAEFEKKGAAIIEKEEHFGWPSSNINLLHGAVRTANNHKSLWEHNKKIPKTVRLLHKLPVVEVNADRIEHSFNGWSAELEAILAEFSIDQPGYAIATDLHRQVQKICKLAPIIRLWSNPKMRAWHWEEVAAIIERELEDPTAIQLGMLDGWDIIKFAAEFQEVNDHVNAEYKLEESLETMAEQWDGYSFHIRALAQSGTYFVQSLHEAKEMVEEQLVKIDSMVSIESATRHGEETKAWKDRLSYVLEVLDLWWTTQKGYLRVRPFFFSKEVGMHLTKEVVLYERLDSNWRETMQAIADRPSLTALSKNQKMLSTFVSMEHDLMQLRHGLGVFLSKARSSFPRLYFLSEEEILDVLSCGYNNPLDVNRYIHKLFPGYRELKSRGESCFVGGIGELGVLPTSKGAELWLNEVEQTSATAVHKMIDRARKSYDLLSRIEWVREQPQQAMLVALHIVWTEATEQVLLEDARREGIRQLLVQKQSEVSEIRSNLTQSISRIERAKVVALAHHDLKQRDVLTALQAQDPRSVHDFAWQSQLRYYWEQASGAVDGKVVMDVLRNKFSYGLEYLGHQTPLVWSDSLERCYKIMGIALGWQLGGAMAGDHATDASEEYVQDLAHSFGTVCFFFSCRLEPKPEVLMLLCQGMAGSSSWLCFEAVDKLSTELMSVISLCILAVQQAVRCKSDTLTINGDTIQLGIATNALQGAPPCSFVTFKSQYGERAVPDSLRVLFRPVLILTHDIEHIIETNLIANGFEQAQALARRAKFAFSLLKEHLPQRSHYDFGEVSLMTTIQATIRLKEKDRNGDEMVQLLQGLLEKMPSITEEDDAAFREAIADTFHGITQVQLTSSRQERLPIVIDGDPLELVRQHCVQEGKKSVVQPWAEKVCQLLEVVDVSKGVIVIGRAMVGKSTCIHSLVSFISAIASKNSIAPQQVEAIYIHPTAMTTASLYGRYDLTNMEWHDGLLSTTFRSIIDRMADPDCHIPHWFTIFDGTMEPDWCDSLMPLIGTHDFLQLPNCQSLPCPTANTFIFEASDLSSASPSAVSRCGIVHLDADDKDWRWLAELKLDEIELIVSSKTLTVGDGTSVQTIDAVRAMLDQVIEPCFGFLRTECKEALEMVSNTHRVLNLLRLFQTLCEESIENENSTFHETGSAGENRVPAHAPELLQMPQLPQQNFGRVLSGNQAPAAKPGTEWVLPHFLFSLIWSAGAVLNSESRSKFDTFLRSVCSSTVASVKATRKNGKPTKAEIRFSSLLPRIGSVYEYAYMDSTKARSGWVNWGELQDSVLSNTTARSIDDVVVPTVDLSRYTLLLGWLIAGDTPILLSGPVASGKTFYVRSRLSKGLSSLKYTNVTVNLSASSTPKYVQKVIQSKLEQGKSGKLAPRGDRHLVIHIEDMNLPEPNQFGTQPALELLRQLLDKGAWHSHAEPPVLLKISNCCIAATMQHSADRPPGVPVRMLRHLHMLHITGMDEEDIRTIFSTILKWYHVSSNFPEPILNLRESIVEGALTVYKAVCGRLKPTPSCPHYRFSMRDLRAIFQGMLLQTAEDVAESLDGADGEHLRLFTHEILRVFYDRIRDTHDKEWFLQMIKDVTAHHLKRDFDTLFSHLDLDGSGDVDADELRRLFFGKVCVHESKVDDDEQELVRLGSSAVESGYDEIEDASELVVRMQDMCRKYDAGSRRPMGLYMSLYSAEHITRIMRALQIKRGHAVLVGKPATGRRSMARMAAYVSKRKLLEPERIVSQPMTFQGWREFVKKLIQDVALGKLVEAVVLLRARQMDDEKMEDLNCLLNGAEIPGLFTHREQVSMIQEVHAKRMTVGDDVVHDKKMRSQHVDQLFSDLMQSAYNRIHVILCLDIEAGDFTDRMVKFPGLGSRCYMDWFEDWPLETMAEMASNTLDEVLEEGWSERQRKQLMEAYGQMYLSAQETVEMCLPQWRRKHNHLSMSSFDAFLKLFKHLLLQNRAEAEEQLSNLLPAVEAVDAIVRRTKEEAALFAEMKDEHAQLGDMEQKLTAKIQQRDKELEEGKAKLEELNKIIHAQEVDLEKMTEELMTESAKLKVVWNKHTHVLVSFSPRDVGKLKSVLNSGSPPEAVAILARAVVTILDGNLIVLPEVKKGLKMDPEDDPMPGVRKVVGSLDFKKRLLNIDRESPMTIKGAMLVKQNHMKQAEFSEKNLNKSCPGSEKLFQWVQGVLKYVDKLGETVLPLQAKIEAAQLAAQPHRELRDSVQAGMEAIVSKYSDEEAKYNELKDTQAGFIQRLKDFRAETARAAKLRDLLISDVVDLRKQWQERVDQIQARKLTLDVDTSLAAAVLTYSGGLRQGARQMLLTKWIKALNDKSLRYKSEFDVIEFMYGTQTLGIELKRWELDGLPTDDFSVLNACIMTKCYRFAYIIDPHQIAFSWLRDTERARDLMCLSLKEDYLGKLRFAVEEGITVLLDDMEEYVPTVLRSLLARKISTSNKRRFVCIGEHMVPSHEDFRLYMTTRLENPDLDPDDAMWVSLVDFNLTRQGLEQSLDVVLLSTKARELSSCVIDNLREHVNSAAELDSLDLVHKFATFKGSILSDQSVVDGVEQSQQNWLQARDSVMKHLRKYKRAKERAKMLRVVTAPLAALFEALWELTGLHESYQNIFFRFAQLILLDLDVELQQYSDHPFLIRNAEIFDLLTAGFKAQTRRDEEEDEDEDEDEEEDEQEERVTAEMRQQMGADLESLSRELTHVVFFDLVRSIYTKHHLIFSFLAAVKTMIVRGVVFPNEWQHFLTNGAMRVPMGVEIQGTRSIEIEDHEENTIVWEGPGRHGLRGQVKRPHPGFSWLSSEQWDGVCRLSVLSTLTKAIGEEGSVADSIVAHPAEWREFLDARDPTTSPLPCALTTRLSPFQRLLLIRVLHPQHVSRGMALVTQAQYGAEVTRIPPVMIAAAHEDSLPHTPLLFLLGPGSDPTADIEAFAKESHFQDKMIVIEGAAVLLPNLKEQMADALEDGYWLLIRNVHTNPELLDNLHQVYAIIAEGDPHVDFRLWITSVPSGLSKDVYRQSMRVVWEAPATVRGSLLRSYSTVPMADPTFGSKDPDTFRKCMFALCFTHAAVMERSLYGELGWNQSVNVDDFDLKYCIVHLRDVLDEFDMVTVKSIRQLVRDLMYAGRMMDTHDLTTVEALLLNYLPDQLVRYGLEYTDDGVYVTPNAVETESYVSYVDSLPAVAPAELFGLPHAADRQRLVAMTDFCLEKLQETQNLIWDESAAEFDKVRLRRIWEIAAGLVKRVPVPTDVTEMVKKHSSAGEGGPADARTRVLVQEMHLRGRLVSAVRKSLEQLTATLEGRLVMMGDMMEVARAIDNGRVPDAWLRFSPPTELPLAQYIHRLMDSDRFLVEWAKSGTPAAFWLPAFFFPEALISATCINLARHHGVGIETVGIHFEVPEHSPSSISVPVTSGSYLTGLHLACAIWDPTLGALTNPPGAVRSAQQLGLTTPLPFLQVRPHIIGQSGGTATPGSESLFRAVSPAESSPPGSPSSSIAGPRSPPTRAPSSGSTTLGRIAALRVHLDSQDARSPGAEAVRRRERESALLPESAMSPMPSALSPQTKTGSEASSPMPKTDASSPLLKTNMTHSVYDCPMYRTWKRTGTSRPALAEAAKGFVMTVPLPCQSSEVKGKPHLTFIKNGTAIFIEGYALD